MPSIRIAVASTPLTATLDEAVPAAIAAIEEAARLGARIVCLPETGLPGHRDQARTVPDASAAELDEAVRHVAEAAGRVKVVTIVGVERPTTAGREIRSVVIDADGAILGEQTKTQIDPSEERNYVPGTGRGDARVMDRVLRVEGRPPAPGRAATPCRHASTTTLDVSLDVAAQ